jgi:hypothetical protein
MLRLNTTVEAGALTEDEPLRDHLARHRRAGSDVDHFSGEQLAVRSPEYRDLPGRDVAGDVRRRRQYDRSVVAHDWTFHAAFNGDVLRRPNFTFDRNRPADRAHGHRFYNARGRST